MAPEQTGIRLRWVAGAIGGLLLVSVGIALMGRQHASPKQGQAPALPPLGEARPVMSSKTSTAKGDAGSGRGHGKPPRQTPLERTTQAVPRPRASTAGPPQGGRPLPSPHVVYVGDEPDRADIPDLEDALGIEDRNEEREREWLTDANELLVDDTTVRDVSARCGTTFCRLIIERDVSTEWESVDDALRPIMIGEMIFQTENASDGTSLAYVYISEPDTVLPLAQPGFDEAHGF